MTNLEEKKLSTTEYYKNSFLRVHEDDVSLPDGGKSKRIVVDHVGATNVVALTEDKKLLVVRQYRYPLLTTTIETPAGKLEPDEAPIATAKRELEEETGYTCDTFTFLGKHATAPGFTNEYLYQFLAVDVKPMEHPIPNDEGEFTEPILLTKEDAITMLESGEIMDLKTVYAIQYLTSQGLW